MLITLSGTMVISCLINIVQGGGGEVLPRFGMLENSPKTVKCVITFETDCSHNFATVTEVLVAFATILVTVSGPAIAI